MSLWGLGVSWDEGRTLDVYSMSKLPGGEEKKVGPVSSISRKRASAKSILGSCLAPRMGLAIRIRAGGCPSLSFIACGSFSACGSDVDEDV